MPGISEFYSGQNVFVTGGSGFMGKVLIEKLLRSCPDVGNIYVLLRPRKGKDVCERLHNILMDPLFDTIKRNNPDNLNKIIPLKGDCLELDLDLSIDDRKLLIEEVSVVFHGAANVRFDDPLKTAVLLNTRGTREVMFLCKDMKKLKVLVHISTTYSNCDRSEVDEIIYPPHADWRKIIDIVETTDSSLLAILTKKIIGVHPNTYTFTKSLAEHVIKDLSENMPVVLFRPSIVISTLEEPITGWTDNFNGPVGLFVAGGKGILRTAYADADLIYDFVPVDLCIKFMILASWLKAISGDNSEPTVYNCSSHNLNTATVDEVINISFEHCRKEPLNDILWWPNTVVRKSFFLYKLETILLHLLPAMFIDGILTLRGKKAILTHLHQKIFIANVALEFFTTRAWIFKNDKFLSMRSQILPCDKKAFKLDHLETIDVEEFVKYCINGGRLYLLKEYPDSLPKAKEHSRRMYWIDRFVRTTIIASILWFSFRNVYLHCIQENINFLFV